MDDPVEVQDDIAMQVIYSFVCELTACLFEAFNMRKSILFQFPQQQLRLLVEIVHLKLLHEGLNLQLFSFDQIVQRHLHPHEHSVHVSSLLLDSKVLFPVQEIVFGFEFVPELFAPLGQDSQDGWALDD